MGPVQARLCTSRGNAFAVALLQVYISGKIHQVIQIVVTL
jgi:hypothetical protein